MSQETKPSTPPDTNEEKAAAALVVMQPTTSLNSVDNFKPVESVAQLQRLPDEGGLRHHVVVVPQKQPDSVELVDGHEVLAPLFLVYLFYHSFSEV